MFCLEKFQKEAARLFNIDLDTLPTIEQSLKARGYKGILRGDERIIFDEFKDEFEALEKAQPSTQPSAQPTGEASTQAKIQSQPAKELSQEQAKELLDNLQGQELPPNLSIEAFLKSLDEFENKDNFIRHLQKSQDATQRLEYLNLVEPTFRNADFELKSANAKGEATTEYIKAFKGLDNTLFYVLISKENDRLLLTGYPTSKKREIIKRLEKAEVIKARDSGEFSSARSNIESPTPQANSSTASLKQAESKEIEFKNPNEYKAQLSTELDNIQKQISNINKELETTRQQLDKGTQPPNINAKETINDIKRAYEDFAKELAQDERYKGSKAPEFEKIYIFAQELQGFRHIPARRIYLSKIEDLNDLAYFADDINRYLDNKTGYFFFTEGEEYGEILGNFLKILAKDELKKYKQAYDKLNQRINKELQNKINTLEEQEKTLRIKSYDIRKELEQFSPEYRERIKKELVKAQEEVSFFENLRNKIIEFEKKGNNPLSVTLKQAQGSLKEAEDKVALLKEKLSKLDNFNNANLSISQPSEKGFFDEPATPLNTTSEKGEIQSANSAQDLSTLKTAEVRELLKADLQAKGVLGSELVSADNIKARFSLSSLAKMLSSKAVQKSLDNGFSRGEHIEAVASIKELFQRANLASKTQDKSGARNLQIYRFNAPFKEANALITIKESTDLNLKKLYSLELELTPRFSTSTPSNTSTSEGSLSSLKQLTAGQDPEAIIAKADKANSSTNQPLSQVFKIDEKLRESLNDRLKEAYDIFKTHNKDSENNALFDKVIKVANDLGGRYWDQSNPKWVNGTYTHYLNRAMIDTKLLSGLNGVEQIPSTILHELIHSVSSRAIFAYKKGFTKILTKEQQEGVQELINLYEAVSKKHQEKVYILKSTPEATKRENEGKGRIYGLANEDEMLAELSNEKFRNFLQKENLWTKIVNAIAKVFSYIKGQSADSATNALKETRAALEKILNNYKKDFTGEFEKWYNVKGAMLDFENYKKYLSKHKEEFKSWQNEQDHFGFKDKPGNSYYVPEFVANTQLNESMRSAYNHYKEVFERRFGVSAQEFKQSELYKALNQHINKMPIDANAKGEKWAQMLESLRPFFMKLEISPNDMRFDKIDTFKQLDEEYSFKLIKDIEEILKREDLLYRNKDIKEFFVREYVESELKKLEESFLNSLELQRAFLGEDKKISFENIKAEALPKANFNSVAQFKDLFTNKKGKFGFIQTPYKELKVNIPYAYIHFYKNTNNVNRNSIKGAFFDTLQNPLFIVEQETDRGLSTYFYKVYQYKGDKIGIVGIGVDSFGKVDFKTLYADDNNARLRQMINFSDESLKYIDKKQLANANYNAR